MGSMTDEKIANLLVMVCEEGCAGGVGIDDHIDDVVVNAMNDSSPEVQRAALQVWMDKLKRHPTYQNAALCGIVLMIDHIKRKPTTCDEPVRAKRS